MSDLKILWDAPKRPPLPPREWPACTQLDHSEYKESTNYWNSLEWVGEKKFCLVCGRPSYQEWFARINWQNRDIAYWREIFRVANDAERGIDKDLPFIYLWESKNWAGERLVHGDEDYDPRPVRGHGPLPLQRAKPALAMLTQKRRYSWHSQHGEPRRTLVEHIRRYRYFQRLTPAKENKYPGYEFALALELAELAEGRDCVDNRRFAALDVRKDMQRYRARRDSGCCGSADAEVTIRGRKFMIGINYGH